MTLNFSKMKKNLRALNILGLLGLNFLIVQNSFADAFYYDYRSARNLGRGDTGITDTIGSDAIFYNPAALALDNRIFKDLNLIGLQVIGSANFQDLYKETKKPDDKALIDYLLTNSNKPYSVSIQNYTGVVINNYAIGSLQRARGNVIITKSPIDGLPGASVNVEGNGGLVLSGAHAFLNNKLLIGATGKFYYKREYLIEKSLADIDTLMQNPDTKKLLSDALTAGYAVGADLGLLYVFDYPTETKLGVTYKNFNMKYDWMTDPDIKIPQADPQQMNIGMSTSFGTRKGRVKLLADFHDVLNQQKQSLSKHTHFGAEYNLLDRLIVMVGLNQGYLTYGLGVNLKVFKFEIGSFSEEMGTSAGQIPNLRYYARLSLGWME